MMRFLAPIALFLSSLSILFSVLLYVHNVNQRREAVSKLCDFEFAMEEFVNAKPDYPRDRLAIGRLRALDCEKLKRDTAR